MEESDRRKDRVHAFLVLLAALPASAGAAPAPYLETAAGLRDRLDPLWRERAGRYVTSSDRTATGVNAAVLAVDSIAARRGAGDPREAARARAIVRWLTGPAVWRGGRTPGWMAGPRGSSLLPVYQSEAVGGLVQAYVARRELALPRRDVDAIRARIRRVARSRAFRWPALNLNQINWYVELIAARAVVEQRPRLLAQGFRRYLNRFLAGVRPRGRAAGNLGPGLRFHYRPSRRPGEPINVDSAEYANIVLSFSRFYAAARAAGMPRPRHARLRLLRGVGAARCGRLLDTRRLSQLGHRLRLRALASDQEADARPADAHRARHSARTAAERPLGSVGAVDARPRPRPVRGSRRADPRAVGLRGRRRSRRRGAPPSSRPRAPR